ncbi:MAG: hypothetical protein QM604_04245 [Microbacterium sp.]
MNRIDQSAAASIVGQRVYDRDIVQIPGTVIVSLGDTMALYRALRAR